MRETRTLWLTQEQRRSIAVSRERTNIRLAFALLFTIALAEAQYLKLVDGANLFAAAESISVGE